MYELLTQPIFVIFASVTLMSVIPSIAHYWHKIRRAELEAALKHDMLQRGMSAEEIQMVLQASTSSSKGCSEPATRKEAAGLAARDE